MSFLWIPDEESVPSWELRSNNPLMEVCVWINTGAFTIGDEPYKLYTDGQYGTGEVEVFFQWHDLLERVREIERTYSI